MLPKKLQNKLEERTATNSLRSLGRPGNLIDFSSNDYLGFSTSETIFNRTSDILKEHSLQQNGATGSRLISGNHSLFETAEQQLRNFHLAESALIFNSGYDANVGIFSSVPQRGDIILYDELCHASIREGIKLSDAKAYKFKHNDLEDLQKRLQHAQSDKYLHPDPVEGLGRDKNRFRNEIYVVTESVFSMDGDTPDLETLSKFCENKTYHLVVDEAHAVGVFGAKGEGLVQELGLETKVFARIITFGKAMGGHGAAILGSEQLKQYLVNFARSFIYTTALPPHSVASICSAYEALVKTSARPQLYKNIVKFQNAIIENKLQEHFIVSTSAIQSFVIPGNERVKKVSKLLKEEGYNVKPILSPTVPKGQERLRICIHSFNTEKEIINLLLLIKQLM